MTSIIDSIGKNIFSDEVCADILNSVKWPSLDASTVESVFAILESKGVKASPGLIQKVVAAGHGVDGQIIMDPFVQAVDSLNKAISESRLSNEKVDTAIQTLSYNWAPGLDILEQALHTLNKLGNNTAVCQIALRHYPGFPEMVKRYRDEISNFAGSLPKQKLKLIGFSTLNHFEKDLATAMLDVGLNATIDYPGYGQVIQQLMMPIENDTSTVNVLLDTRSIINPDWRLSSEENYQRCTRQFDDFLDAIQVCINQNGAMVVANTLLTLPTPSFGFIDHIIENSEDNLVRHFNSKLFAFATQNKNFSLINTENALAEIAPSERTSSKLEYYGNFAFSGKASRHLARAFASFHAVSSGKLAKVLVLDLDNTMWGGVYGDDGLENLIVGDTFPGNAFQQFQQECLRLKQQGFLLAILSKNNADAISVFSDHPGMILTEDDIVASRINWMPKHENVVELAKELNLGLNSFIFLDDSPYERSAMRMFAPEVMTPELPVDVAERPNFIRKLAETWVVRLTEEDRKRSNLYMAEKHRIKDLKAAPSLEAYIKGLEQKLNIYPVEKSTLARAAQLHMRTNQFNLTTERYDELRLSEMIDDPAGNIVLVASVTDRYGDHGIILASTIERRGEEAEIKSLVMSCRVFGRGIESAYLSAVLVHLNKLGIKTLHGTYKPTKKNAIVKDFYSQNGFEQTNETEDAQYFRLDLSAQSEYTLSGSIETILI